MTGLRSRRWFDGDDDIGLEHRAALRSSGVLDGGSLDRPVVAVLNSASDLNPCNLPLGALAEAAKDGVRAAGGIPVEVSTMSLGEDLMKPTAMLYRNLMAIEVEETIRAYPVDGVVLLGNCDKTIPAQLMGAASADVPAVQVSGGYRRPGLFRGAELGAGTDLWRYTDERRAGRVDDEQWAEIERALGCSLGACNVMGTAMTMAILAETLGMMVPGSATLPFDDDRLTASAAEAGRTAVRLAQDDVRPSAVLTRPAFENAMLALAAAGGSTNAIVHLTAIAGRRGITLDLDEFDAAARRVPVLVDVTPVGRHHIDAFDAAGGVPALLDRIGEHLHPDLPSVTGGTDEHASLPTSERSAIRDLHEPVQPPGSLAVLRGSLAPDGAVLKAGAADPRLLHHRGTAVVFDGYQDLRARIDSPDLEVDADSVLVLRGCGPRGGDGFPEWGMIPIPARLARDGVRDMVRISDARMSGTSYGTCVLHVAPDAAAGGPLAAVRDGDTIVLEVEARRLDLEVDADEVEHRLESLPARRPRHRRGWSRLFDEHALQAPEGVDFDFLRPDGPDDLDRDDPVIGRS